MKEFNIAAKDAAGEDEEVLEIPFGERTLLAKRPTAGQIALFYDRAASDPTTDEPDNGPVGAVFNFLRGVLAEGDVPYLKKLISDGSIDFDLLLGGDDKNDRGLVDAIMEEWAGRPTGPSSDSSPSREATGRRSTGRSPGKGSTRSASPSTDS